MAERLARSHVDELDQLAQTTGCLALSFDPKQQSALWVAHIPLAQRRAPWLLSYLDARERLRLLQMSDARRREAFTVGHGLLRLVLSIYTGGIVWPGQWQFAVGAHGKPRLLPPPDIIAYYGVSLSYSLDAVALAIAENCKTGVDLEAADQCRTQWPFMTEAEKRAFHSATRDEFLCLWTTKEAVAKCRGIGLGVLGRGKKPPDDMTLLNKRFRYGDRRFFVTVATQRLELPSR